MNKEEIKEINIHPIPEELISGDLGYDEEGNKILNFTELQEALNEASVVSPIRRNK